MAYFHHQILANASVRPFLLPLHHRLSRRSINEPEAGRWTVRRNTNKNIRGRNSDNKQQKTTADGLHSHTHTIRYCCLGLFQKALSPVWHFTDANSRLFVLDNLGPALCTRRLYRSGIRVQSRMIVAFTLFCLQIS